MKRENIILKLKQVKVRLATRWHWFKNQMIFSHGKRMFQFTGRFGLALKIVLGAFVLFLALGTVRHIVEGKPINLGVSNQGKIKQVTEDYIAGLADNDGAAVCDLLTEKSQEIAASEASEDFDLTCEQSFGLDYPQPKRQRDETLKQRVQIQKTFKLETLKNTKTRATVEFSFANPTSQREIAKADGIAAVLPYNPELQKRAEKYGINSIKLSDIPTKDQRVTQMLRLVKQDGNWKIDF